MSVLKSPAEMDRIRKVAAVIREKEMREFIPEKNEHKPIAYFEISRYTTGSFRGLFLVAQMIADDSQGRPLKRPIRKVIAEGVDMVVAMSSLETALRRKVFK